MLKILLCLILPLLASSFILPPSPTSATFLNADAARVTNKSGLQYSEVTKDTGKAPGKKDFVSLHYTGKFKNGKVFDSSRSKKDPRAKAQQGKLWNSPWEEEK